MHRRLVILLALVTSSTGVAVAQPGAGGAPAAAEGAPAAAEGAPAAAQPAAAAAAQPAEPSPIAQAPAAGAPPPPYESPRRAECDAELARDARWTAELEQEFIRDFHAREGRLVTTNNRHVILAYGGLWVLTAGFLALMFLRQRKLDAEIDRLEAEVKKAAAS